MFLKTFALLLVIGSALAMMPLKPKIDADRSLMDFMLQPRGAGSGNPQLNQYCFNRYLPILKDITDQYESDYNKCVEVYDAQCAAVDSKFANSRSDVSKTVQETCDSLQKCDGIVNYLDAFECFAGTGSEQSKILFSLSSDSVQNAGLIREQYRAAESTAELCANSAERIYWENTDKTYAEMKDCLDGIIVEPSTVSSSSTSEGTTQHF